MALTRDMMLEQMRRRDPAFDGRFLFGVTTTGIYCRPSCGARRPRPENVDFFRSVSQAEAAGLRPCKRCRPDLFHRGEDPDLALVERLAGEVRDDPAAFENVHDLVRRSGVGSSKLGELVRQHYHVTPTELLGRARVELVRRRLHESRRPVTEIAFDAGYETLSAFNYNFRRRARMSPQAYRRLTGASAFALGLPSWYSTERALRYLGRDPKSVTERVDGRVVAFALSFDGGGTARISVELWNREARCRVEPVSGRVDESWGGLVHERVLRLLGLVTDPVPFERRLAPDAKLVRLVDAQKGLVIPQTRNLVDGLVWVVAGQQVSLPVAFSMRRQLIERFGRRVGEGGLCVLPSLETLAGLSEAELVGAGFSRRKAEYLSGVTRAAVSGELDLEALERTSATTFERTFLAVRGLGPWSVHYLMMRSLGFADCVPVGDVALAESLKRFFDLDRRPDAARTRELMSAFAPYRSLATFHLWERLGNAHPTSRGSEAVEPL